MRVRVQRLCVRACLPVFVPPPTHTTNAPQAIEETLQAKTQHASTYKEFALRANALGSWAGKSVGLPSFWAKDKRVGLRSAFGAWSDLVQTKGAKTRRQAETQNGHGTVTGTLTAAPRPMQCPFGGRKSRGGGSRTERLMKSLKNVRDGLRGIRAEMHALHDASRC